MIGELRDIIARNLVNYRGWSTDRKIVVIESDDWGSIRMPSKDVYNSLLSKGVPVQNSYYCRYDSLASETDLELLFELLSGLRDGNDNHPIVTANVVVSNPNFEKIKESNYEKYFCEPITDTFKKYPNHGNCIPLWKQGNDNGLFHPQSHGKEHLNIQNWFRHLQNGEYDYRLAFEYEMWGLSSDVYPGMENSVQASLDVDGNSDQKDIEVSVRSGLQKFEELFGYKSESFIANNFIWGNHLNHILAEEGVRYLQGMKYQKLPRCNGEKRKRIRRYLGDINEEGQIYLIRNCAFEPSLSHAGHNSVSDSLKDISTAFKWNKPAIITSHRLNYIGFLEERNRDDNLRKFRELLTCILKRWPDVEFMTSDGLGALISRDVNKTVV